MPALTVIPFQNSDLYCKLLHSFVVFYIARSGYAHLQHEPSFGSKEYVYKVSSLKIYN